MQIMFSGLCRVEAGDAEEVSLGEGYSLVRPNDYLLSARDEEYMTRCEWREAAGAARYLVYKTGTSPSQVAGHGETYDEIKRSFLCGLMALEILKPTRTLGILFHGDLYDVPPDNRARFVLHRIERRPPMEPDRWARERAFDKAMLDQVPRTIKGVRGIMDGPSAEKRNAVILLQLGLEHFHPLVSGLLWVTGLDAIFDSGGRRKFRQKLCDCLGEESPAFPDWHPRHSEWRVGDIGGPLYVLRSKLAHGIDLRKAALDSAYPVDLTKKLPLPGSSSGLPFVLLLCHAACYLLCRVLQKEVGQFLA